MLLSDSARCKRCVIMVVLVDGKSSVFTSESFLLNFAEPLCVNAVPNFWLTPSALSSRPRNNAFATGDPIDPPATACEHAALQSLCNCLFMNGECRLDKQGPPPQRKGWPCPMKISKLSSNVFSAAELGSKKGSFPDAFL